MQDIKVEDVHYFREALNSKLKFFNDLSETRQLAIISLCFVYGVKTLLMKKQLMLALENNDFERAAQEILEENSKCHYIADAIKCDMLDETGEN